jgi:hypothetical protein
VGRRDRQKNSKLFLFLLCVWGLAVLFSGCALLQIPLELIKIPLMLAKEAVKIASKLPRPPPGVLGPF